MREIEAAAHMRFTGIVNNSNIGEITAAEDVLASVPYAAEISEKADVPIRMTTVLKSLCPLLEDKIENIMPLTLYVEQSWAERNE